MTGHVHHHIDDNVVRDQVVSSCTFPLEAASLDRQERSDLKVYLVYPQLNGRAIDGTCMLPDEITRAFHRSPIFLG